MAIKRLHEGFGIGQDSCISGNHPMREDDLRNGTEGVFLGVNPESPSKGLFITYWEADEIAQKIGFPHIAVYAEQKRLIDEQAQRIADLEHQLDNEINTLQVEAIAKEIRKNHKELHSAFESTTAAVRARLGNSGGHPDTSQGAAVRTGAAKEK